MGAGAESAILEGAPDAVLSTDEWGCILYWNTRAESMFGVAREGAIGRVLADTIICARDHDAYRQAIGRLMSAAEPSVTDQPLHLNARRADGGEFPIEMAVSVRRASGAHRWSLDAFIRDVSQREETEQDRPRLPEELERSLSGGAHGLAAIMDALAEAVTIRDLEDRIIYANRAALVRLGFDSLDQLRSAPPAAIMGDYLVEDEHGREIGMRDIPSVRLLRGEPAPPLLMRSVNRASGVESWTVLKAAPLKDAGGALEASVTIIEDVTVARRSELRAGFLARASEVLSSSLDYQKTLRNVAGLAVPQIADWCVVELLDEDRKRDQVAVAHADPSKLQIAERLREYESHEPDPGQGVGLVMRSGEPQIYTEISDDLLAQAAVDEEHLRLLREVGFRSVLIIPMKVAEQMVGVMTLVNAESGRIFDHTDLEFAGQIADRASVAVVNARLYTERSDIARTLQRSLLPDRVPDVAGWEIDVLYRPAGHGSRVGGDFYDFWLVDDHWMVLVGDVTGKGVSAASLTSLVRHTARVASEFEPYPAHILARVDGALKRRPSLSPCTALCLRLAGASGTVAAGGHPLLLKLSPDGVTELGAPGPLLGGFPDARWQEASFSLQQGQTLVAYTDGVTDTVGPGGQRFGIGRLKETLAAARHESPATIIKCLNGALERFQLGAQADDTAMVVMRYRGS